MVVSCEEVFNALVLNELKWNQTFLLIAMCKNVLEYEEGKYFSSIYNLTTTDEYHLNVFLPPLELGGLSLNPVYIYIYTHTGF